MMIYILKSMRNDFVSALGIITILLLQVMLMGMGSLTGIAKLEVYAWYAVIFNLVNFIVYMTFFPSGLSLILELMYCHDGRPRWNVKVSTYTPAVKMQINSVCGCMGTFSVVLTRFQLPGLS